MSDRKRLRVSVSGGRTSAFMAGLIKQNFSVDEWDIRYVFANTSSEHPDTYRFLRAVDEYFCLGLTLLEAVVHPASRKSCTHRVVAWDSLRTNNEVFEEVVAKYGIPNQTFKLCTRELKTNPMEWWSESIGWETGSYYTAIGIRADETRRVSARADAQKIIYPLVHIWPTDKSMVLDYFEQFDWDLAIPEHQGNCKFCHKKSKRKLQLVYQETPEAFEFPIHIERNYADVGPNNVPGPRKQYRGYTSASELVAEFQAAGYVPMSAVEDGGCSESCEVYETEQLELTGDTR
ncbi:hypothetical protein [Burkholderia gladioli]|uniref:hypothetical protein n=1 Tax=Burkholderia gladioli TaxID=28095 RepID=UPI00164130A4|nr:hypothetical protein [Burkholderia gladioli]